MTFFWIPYAMFCFVFSVKDYTDKILFKLKRTQILVFLLVVEEKKHAFGF